jgi:hypothetical protein
MAHNIFQFGYKTYGHIPEFISSYIEFLTHMNGNLKEEEEKFIGFYSIIFLIFR